MKLGQIMIFMFYGIIISLGSFLVGPHVSFSETVENSVKDLLSRSDLSSITITGESSINIEPDQLSIFLNVQTPPNIVNFTASDREAKVKNVVDTIISIAEINQTSIKVGQTSLNPIYSGDSPLPATLFNAYSTVQIKTDDDNLAELSSNLIDGGFRIDNINISQIKVPINGTVSQNNVDVSLVFNSSIPDNLEFYSPSDITVDLGTTVVWTNKDSAAHTVTSGEPSIGPTGVFDSALFSSGQTFEHQFNTFGVHDYFCLVHPWMTGTVTVPEGEDSILTEIKYQININIAIETPPSPLGDTIKNYETKLSALKKILNSTEISLDSIQSNQVNFNPLYYGYGGGQSAVYSAYTQIIVKTDLAKIEPVLKAAKDSGASVENIIMSISDSKIDEIKSELTQKALEDAMKSAQEILESSGLQIKGIKTIKVNTEPAFQYGGGPVVYKGVNLWSQHDASYIRSGEASVSVTVEFEIGR